MITIKYLKVLHDPTTLYRAYGHEHSVEVLLGHGLGEVVDDEIRPTRVACGGDATALRHTAPTAGQPAVPSSVLLLDLLETRS